MSKLAILDTLLMQYKQLRYHQDPILAQRLKDVQDWQKQRMYTTHAAHFSAKNHQLMAEYFMQRLYGGQDFDALAAQIERLIQYAHKAEKVLPESAIHTGTTAIQLAILAVQLDENIAQQLLIDYPSELPLNNDMMRLCYLKLQQADARLEQLQQLDQLGIFLDKYLRSFVVQTAFKMCKGAAYKYQFNVMYDFMHAGFSALKPLKSAERFVRDFSDIERQIVHKVHAGHLHPFD